MIKHRGYNRYLYGALLIAFLIAATCSPQEDTNPPPGVDPTILSSDRKIDWSRAGVWADGVKGIPNYPVGITVNTTNTSHQYYCDPTGATDCRPKPRAALNASPDGQAVYMPAGTYRINSSIVMPSDVALRGAGPTQTTIKSYYSEEAINMFGEQGSETATNITSGYTKGSQTIVVANATAFSVGALVLIDQ